MVNHVMITGGNNMLEMISHSFEAGRRGKPDELDSGIANLLGAYILGLDELARFDLRVSGSFLCGKPLVRVSGEISDFVLKWQDVKDEMSRIILSRYNAVHRSELGPADMLLEFNLKPQANSLASNGFAGDSGNPIAVAYQSAPNHLPWERYLAVDIRDLIDRIFNSRGLVPPELAHHSGVTELKGLRADGKVSVEALYAGCCLDSICKITLAVEHESTLPIGRLRDGLGRIVDAYLGLLAKRHGRNFRNPEIEINGAGEWHSGGWEVDEGSREAKPYRDGFASYGLQEDSFSGEDPTKPSGTGTFIARYVAVQVVGSGLADFARVALSYTIGKEDVGLNIVTNGTGSLPQEELEHAVRISIPLKIKQAIELFGLRDPCLFRRIVAGSDYFQDPKLPWNLASRSWRDGISH
jgi:S-adenosylmethionine synthetase